MSTTHLCWLCGDIDAAPCKLNRRIAYVPSNSGEKWVFTVGDSYDYRTLTSKFVMCVRCILVMEAGDWREPVDIKAFIEYLSPFSLQRRRDHYMAQFHAIGPGGKCYRCWATMVPANGLTPTCA